MAVMHETTFELYHNDQTICPDGYAEIDELIAPAIQVLNQKGYATRFCCSGHPTNDWLMIDGETEAGYDKANVPINAYILFRERITLPSLPPGFETENYPWDTGTTIRKYYHAENAEDDGYFAMAKQILEAMEELYRWALALPEFEGK